MLGVKDFGRSTKACGRLTRFPWRPISVVGTKPSGYDGMGYEPMINGKGIHLNSVACLEWYLRGLERKIMEEMATLQ